MQALKVIVMGGLLAVASTAAVAFQEQQQGQAPKAAEPPAAAAPAAGGAGFATPVPAPGKGSGTEIRIPGLGSLGVLPKMDFGLELLYGAAESKSSEQSRAVAPEGSDDLQIKGTLRRRF